MLRQGVVCRPLAVVHSSRRKFAVGHLFREFMHVLCLQTQGEETGQAAEVERPCQSVFSCVLMPAVRVSLSPCERL